MTSCHVTVMSIKLLTPEEKSEISEKRRREGAYSSCRRTRPLSCDGRNFPGFRIFFSSLIRAQAFSPPNWGFFFKKNIFCQKKAPQEHRFLLRSVSQRVNLFWSDTGGWWGPGEKSSTQLGFPSMMLYLLSKFCCRMLTDACLMLFLSPTKFLSAGAGA